MTGISRSIDTFKALVLRYPKRTLFVACCLFLAGISEGLGIGALLPLLKLFLGGEGVDNWFTRTVGGFLSSIGFEPTAGTLLAFIAALIMLKGALVSALHTASGLYRCPSGDGFTAGPVTVFGQGKVALLSRSGFRPPVQRDDHGSSLCMRTVTSWHAG